MLRYFDAEGEAYPPELDFEELDRQAQSTIDKRVDKLGGVELTARGASVEATVNVAAIGAAACKAERS